MFCNCKWKISRLEKKLKLLMEYLGGEDSDMLLSIGVAAMGQKGELGEIRDRANRASENINNFSKALGYEKVTCVEETKWKKIKKGGKNGNKEN